MSNYLSSTEAKKEQHSGNPHFSGNNTRVQFSMKLKSILESPHEDFGGEMSRLPKDIVLDIFSRLSVKDLKNCIPVRKSWYQTVLSPNFTKLHNEKSIMRIVHTTSFITHDDSALEESTKYDLYLVQCESFKDPLSNICEVLPLRTKFKERNVKYDLVGSCQGLLCLSDPPLGDPVYICNPIIGEYMTLPSAPEETNVDIISGFGYDTVAGLWKVIRMVYQSVEYVDNQILLDLQAEVYSLGLKNWRRIGYVPYRPSANNPGVFLNGFIHWLSDWELCEEESCDIVCFNVSTDQFSLIPLPPGYGRYYLASGMVELLDIEGRLCLSDHGVETVVWVMKEYGVEQSWTKQLPLDELFLKLHVLKEAIPGLPLMYEFCNHVASLISYKDADEDQDGQEGYNKLETWSSNLCATSSPYVMAPPESLCTIPLRGLFPYNAYGPVRSQVPHLIPYDHRHQTFSYVLSQALSDPNGNAIPANLSDDGINGGLGRQISLYEFLESVNMLPE